MSLGCEISPTGPCVVLDRSCWCFSLEVSGNVRKQDIFGGSRPLRACCTRLYLVPNPFFAPHFLTAVRSMASSSMSTYCHKVLPKRMPQEVNTNPFFSKLLPSGILSPPREKWVAIPGRRKSGMCSKVESEKCRHVLASGLSC